MSAESVRATVRRKLESGELPRNGVTRFWGAPSTGETCDACDNLIEVDHLLVEAITTESRHGLRCHIGCFAIWHLERDGDGAGTDGR